MDPFFSVIIPTYKRKEKLMRAVDSVLNQNYERIRIIIVNDSPDDGSYEELGEKYAADSRIEYLVNEKNSGVNFSRNRGLDHATEGSWIIFLDDDDYLAKGALAHLALVIRKHASIHWIITNRAETGGASLTKISPKGLHKDYAPGFLITKKYRGDATHCIQKNNIKGIYFPKTIKQGDEWLFYYELSTRSPFFYDDFNATITDGYDEAVGLNYRKRSALEQLKTIKLLFKEGLGRSVSFRATFLAYCFIRIVRAFIKN